MRIDEDYRIKGFHKKITLKDNGDIDTVEYYKKFDGVNYSKLEVKETRVITRDVNTKLPIHRDLKIEFYKAGIKVIHTKNYKKYYTADRAYAKNKEATQRVFDKAAMYLASQIGNDNAKAFLRTVVNEVSAYKDQDRQPLLDAINNSADTNLTTIIKSTLISILDINF